LREKRTMSEILRLADQLQRAYDGGAWHGPALREILGGLDAPRAAARPLPGAHSIWEVVNHVSAWTEVLTRRLAGEAAVEPAEGDWPPVPEPTERAWRAAIATLEGRRTLFLEAVRATSPQRLDEPIAAGMSTVAETLHGAIQHVAYHAGQIAILRKD
jgi:uncharacterized damage-inducible protein DinB